MSMIAVVAEGHLRNLTRVVDDVIGAEQLFKTRTSFTKSRIWSCSAVDVLTNPRQELAPVDLQNLIGALRSRLMSDCTNAYSTRAHDHRFERPTVGITIVHGSDPVVARRERRAEIEVRDGSCKVPAAQWKRSAGQSTASGVSAWL